MSHGSEQSEDYWPGYVDALTSMVQVLAFVMMMLAMAVFVLSQNVSKSAVQAIAKAAKVDVPANSSVKTITEAIVKQIEQKESQPSKPTEGAPSKPTEATPSKPTEAAAPEAKENGNKSAAAVQSTMTLPSRKPPEPPKDAKSTIMRFQPRMFRVDQATSQQVEGFIVANKLAESTTPITIRAYATEGEGAISEARRIAYYRALTARKELLERKVPSSNITIKIFDTPDKSQGETVEIVFGSGG
jgi:hypothetical protein